MKLKYWLSALVALLVVVAIAWNFSNRELDTSRVDSVASEGADREVSTPSEVDGTQQVRLSD